MIVKNQENCQYFKQIENIERNNFKNTTVRTTNITAGIINNKKVTKEAKRVLKELKSQYLYNKQLIFSKRLQELEEDNEDNEDNEENEEKKENTTLHIPKRPRTSSSSVTKEGGYARGAIRELRVHNWMTYDDVDLRPGPGLNLVIGANGSGKSSLVCALAVVLGGQMNTISRGDDLTDFIKKGCSEAFIEVELHNPLNEGVPGRIKRIIRGEGRGNQWLWNGVKKTQKEMRQMIDQMNVDVDNLCQFLAQDRVSGFSSLEGPELLLETERCIGNSELYNDHMTLITLSKDMKKWEDMKKGRTQEIGTLEMEKSRKDSLMRQFRSRQALETKLNLLRSKQKWMELKQIEIKMKEVENELRVCTEQLKLKKRATLPLQKQKEQYDKEIHRLTFLLQNCKAQLSHKDTTIVETGRRIQDMAQELDRKLVEIKEQEQKVTQVRFQRDTSKREVTQLQSEFAEQDRQIATVRAEEVRVKEQRDQKRGELVRIQREQQARNSKMNQIRHDVEAMTRNKERLENTREDKVAAIFRGRNEKQKPFYLWVQRNAHQFKGEVRGPLLLHTEAKTQLDCRYLNTVISEMSWYSYVATDKEDWELLNNQVQRMRLKIHIIHRPDIAETYTRPMDSATMQQLYIHGYLDQLIIAESLVKNTLTDMHDLFRIGYSNRTNFPNDVLDKCLRTHHHATNCLDLLCLPERLWSIKISRYDGKSVQSSRDLNHRVCLKPTIDHSDEIKQLDADITTKKQELENLDKDKREIERNAALLESNIRDLAREMEELKEKSKSHAILERKLGRKKDELEALEKEYVATQNQALQTQDQSQWIAQHQKKKVGLVETLVTLYGEKLEEMKQQHLLQIQIEHIRCELKHLLTQLAQDEKKFSHLEKGKLSLETELEKLRNTLESYKGECSEEMPEDELEEQFEKAELTMPTNLQTMESMIREMHSRIGCICYNQEDVDNFFELEKRIHKKQKDMECIERDLASTSKKIEELSQTWRNNLHAKISEISEHFSRFFKMFSAEGKIELTPSNDPNTFEQWSIDILTQFRPAPDSIWKCLSSYVQSGGEKSVATMLYLLSLQHVTNVPFRVVDEINQGMDPKNERKIHDILVDVCRPRKDNTIPQYFVITPKLLPNLKYSEYMTVFIIFNGPFQVPQEKKKKTYEIMVKQKVLFNNRKIDLSHFFPYKEKYFFLKKNRKEKSLFVLLHFPCSSFLRRDDKFEGCVNNRVLYEFIKIRYKINELMITMNELKAILNKCEDDWHDKVIDHVLLEDILRKEIRNMLKLIKYKTMKRISPL
ncbi:hypothetical protein RFI_32726 [Reticulomyxa filosa]|uniref:Structural maintenance of chromosomes protein 5 n=1 Tax=Reticulomyxa filosa TaxID=46433 RepID=X6LSP0_RETFI|nr:hypothetical protein RFI_32726 [Reticulomyxa filosa]|eukprot:ETO04669.1 hypothetical protein RFI_32726 [Reticulomyxa filosa]